MFDLKNLSSILDELQKSRGISKEEILDAISHALAAAYKKEYGEKGQVIIAKINEENGDVDFFRVKEVVSKDDIFIPKGEKITKEELEQIKNEGKVNFSEARHILLEDAKLIKADAKPGDKIYFDLEKKSDFGRMAAMSAKQVIRQKLKEAEKAYLVKEYGSMIGEIVRGEVLRMERGVVYIDLGKAEGVLPYQEQIRKERYNTGDKINAYLLKIEKGYKGNIELYLSRTHPDFLRKLFEQEVPEIKEGRVEIKKIVREPGVKAKVAVESLDEGLDPVGTFIGQSGGRILTVSTELSGEKIDVIEWSEDIYEYLAAAIGPADILDIKILKEKEGDEFGVADIFVPEDQFSLAVGRDGVNIKLASKLTGYKVNIKIVED